MTIKDRKQQEFCEKYLAYRYNCLNTSPSCSPNCTIISATGTGKSSIALKILEEIHKEYDKILIVVNADRLRDFTWKEEFKKWNKQHILDKVQLVNYQSIYKWTEDLTNCFIVYDEVDYAIGTPEYAKVFDNYRNVHSLGLTGYCAASKLDELKKYLPIIVEYAFEEAVADGVINDVKFIFVKYALDREKTMKVEYTDKVTKQKKSFMQSENDSYEYADKQFRIAYGLLSKAESDIVLGMCSAKELARLNFDMVRKRSIRINMLYNCQSSIKIVKELEDRILKDESNKLIIFSKFTAQCDKISKYTYHSKNTDEVNNLNIKNFNEGVIRTLGVCSKIDRGENLVGLNNAILESYNGSDTIITQRRGRNSRLDVDQVATFYVMLPYFTKKNKEGQLVLAETQAVSWARTMLKDKNWDEIETINLIR